MFDRLAKVNLTLNLAKCEFAKATLVYLSMVVGQGQVRPVQAKMEAITKYSVPKGKKEGFCLNFSAVVAPLTDLLRKNTPFAWSSQCQVAFSCVKKLSLQLLILESFLKCRWMQVTLVLELFFCKKVRVVLIFQSASSRVTLIVTS